MKLINVTDRKRIFTLNDGTTLRMLPTDIKTVADNLITDDITIAIDKGNLVIMQEETPVVQNKKSKEE